MLHNSVRPILKEPDEIKGFFRPYSSDHHGNRGERLAFIFRELDAGGDRRYSNSADPLCDRFSVMG